MGKQFKERTESRTIEVTDDWCNYPDNKVKLSIILRGIKPYPKAGEDKRKYYVRVMAWGMDDFGVTMDYESTITGDFGRQYAEGVYDFWKEYIYDRVPEGVNREWFYEHGFLHA